MFHLQDVCKEEPVTLVRAMRRLGQPRLFLDGNIASGKSTLLKDWERKYNIDNGVFVYHEPDNFHYYATLTTRGLKVKQIEQQIMNERRSVEENWIATVSLYERSCLSAITVFDNYFSKDRGLPVTEVNWSEHEYDGDYLILMPRGACDPETCFARAIERKTPESRYITQDYLTSLDVAIYCDLVKEAKRLGMTVLQLTVADAEILNEIINAAINLDHETLDFFSI